ncbi:MAG TPA: class I SAM-dependent methyltransferase [Gemmatimonadaceae bacterium]|nr:class I SAM-dependent methyltransferase [Gemmatimonadaceae bacterium]
MVTVDRWQAAQQYERSYWENFASQIADGSVSQMDWYKWRADNLAEKLGALGLKRLTSGRAKVIEVGCGPIGVAGFFPAAERVAVDPLEDFYGTNEVLSALRNPAVQYRKGVGEALPAEDGGFDLAIIENCIDHVHDMQGVMRELTRVLKPGGVLYLTVNCRTKLGFVVHRALSSLRLDPGHPHTFTPPRVGRLMESHGFDVLSTSVESYLKALREDITSPQTRARLKAVLGISEFVTTAFGQKR